ncbi:MULTISPECIES: pseudouridine synthase [unclassified Enterococcus]|uniref:pseudouridine synthase n=1 Tax=unclassified Enterococcus TaxID=2608891 RepID=UPI001552EEA1|nr:MULTISPECIES: pseudouridine synthase [unclassified Enterococcus]MBS7575942.1 rRNA pseudouridine synthase [Enterococcus sp. MMGLQ5-2]MBS7583175.1 rRNA pseudouridine synthase [Enterococcus sp. MMGLQ5-1]NPD11035.1 rRNA pseudouridine synthase [Enterococcus sp. MMGLQ5-1]NPD35778.1 rRNA pseudouridine synthase [Enterococcus sp. MMGLQ5-2]
MKRIDKLLAELNFGSRKTVRQMIKQKRVQVNGVIIQQSDFKIAEVDNLVVDGQVIEHQSLVYYLLNKPKGYISATEDLSQRTVLELIDELDRRKGLFPVGRLDKDTTGLLIITNDGMLAHQLLSPKNHVDKVYFAEIQGIVSEQLIEVFADGLLVSKDFKALPSELEVLKSDTISEIKLTIHEGKFHQVKRMFKAVGLEVLNLDRIQMKALTLGQLKRGSYRKLTANEIESLKNI